MENMNNLRGKNLCNPHKFMRHRKTPTNTVTHPGLMALKEGVVWVGCPDAACKKMVAVKKCKEHEYIVQDQLSKHFKFIPKIFAHENCMNGFLMYYEYMPDGSLKRATKNLDVLVLRVLKELKTIHDKFPRFRHNDLHVDNVLIKCDTPYIFDFELSNWNGNPVFDRVYKEDYGIFPGNNPMYDFHFFINSCSADLPKRFKDKALTVFPKEYLTANSTVVKNFRLRYDADHKNLPTMDQVIKAFSVSEVNKMRTKVLTFTGKEKKTAVRRSPPTKKTGVKFSRANKERVAVRKIQLLNKGMNNVEAELKAIKNIEKLKMAGLLTPSPSPKKMSPPKAVVVPRVIAKVVAGPSRPAPVLLFTETPRRRPRIDKKLCTSYKKDELMNVMRRLGHRVDKHMTLKEMCLKLKAPPMVSYVRPSNNAILNARKKTYPTHLRKNLYQLGKITVAGVLSKNKKADIVKKLYSKLNKNILNVLKKSNKSTVTQRQIAEKLAKNYGWKNDRHIERLRILTTYKNFIK